MSTATLDRALVLDLAAGRLAGDGIGPWRIEPRGDSLDVYVDRARHDPARDPDGRAVRRACGAAVFRLRVTAAAAGREAVVRLLPDPDDLLHAASVRLGGATRATATLRELAPAVSLSSMSPSSMSLSSSAMGASAAGTSRGASRSSLSGGLPPALVHELRDLAVVEGAALHVLPEELAAGVVEVVPLVAEPGPTGAVPTDLPAAVPVSATVTASAGSSLGVPSGSVLASPATSPSATGPALAASRRGRGLLQSARLRLPRASRGRAGLPGQRGGEQMVRLAVLTTARDRPIDALRAGQALERLRLTALAAGGALGLVAEPFEDIRHRLLLADLLGTPEAPHALLVL